MQGYAHFEAAEFVKAAAAFEESQARNPEGANGKKADRAIKVLRNEIQSKEDELAFAKKQFLATLNRRKENRHQKAANDALLEGGLLWRGAVYLRWGLCIR